jgi:photosystem II stability/assembly factor-like uncharacterized protein
MKKLLTILAFILSLSAINAAEPYWELYSMTPPRGMVWNFAQSKITDNIFLSSNNGVFKSTNHGESWRLVLSGGPVYKVIITDNGYLFAIQRWGLNYGTDNNKHAVYRSFDDGETWESIKDFWTDQPSGGSVCAPFNVISDGNYIFMSLIKDILGDEKLDFYYTNDFGNSWSKSFTLIAKESINEQDLNFVQSKINYFKDSTIIQCKLDSDSNFLLKSKDFGKSWSKTSYGFYINEFYSVNKNELYITTTNGLYYSSDEGDNWSLKWLEGVFTLNMIKKNDTIIVSTFRNGIYYSHNGGDTWENIKPIDIILDYKLDDVYTFPQSPFTIDNNGRIYNSQGESGIYITDDGGNSWQESDDGFSALNPYDLIFNKKGEALITARGVFKSDPTLKNWKLLGLKGYSLKHIAENSKGKLFACDWFSDWYFPHSIFRSTDDGKTWSSLGEYYAFWLLCSTNDVLLRSTGDNAPCTSSDDGDTWVCHDILHSRIGVNGRGNLFSLGWCDLDYPSCIYSSIDNGKTWNFVGGDGYWGRRTDDYNSPFYFQFKTVFNNKTKSSWFGPAEFDFNLQVIYKTTDDGLTWKSKILNNDYDWYPSSDLVAVDSLGCWIAPRDGYGIYRSCNDGESWQLMDTTGFLVKKFGPIGVSPDGYIYVFGLFGGLYRSRDKFVSVEEKPKPNDEITINPNPATDFIEVQNPNYEKVSILNFLGETIFTTSEATKIDVSSFPMGIYLVKIGDKVSKFVKL